MAQAPSILHSLLMIDAADPFLYEVSLYFSFSFLLEEMLDTALQYGARSEK
jgi:hypothetical protein